MYATVTLSIFSSGYESLRRCELFFIRQYNPETNIVDFYPFLHNI